MNITTNGIEKGLKSFMNGLKSISDSFANHSAEIQHPWYISPHLAFAFDAFAHSIKKNFIELNTLNLQHKRIALILRNDAPLEGFDILLHLLLKGNICQLSIHQSQEELLKLFLELLHTHLPQLSLGITSVNQRFSNVDCIVYDGPQMNETWRSYLNHKHLLELRNKEFPVFLTGKETPEMLHLVARDITIHFGRAADSVRNIQVPTAYDFDPLVNALETYSDNQFHSRYFKHYEYQKAAMLVNSIPHIDNGYVLICDDISYRGKIAVVTFQTHIEKNLCVGFGQSGKRFFQQSTVLNNWLSNM